MLQAMNKIGPQTDADVDQAFAFWEFMQDLYGSRWVSKHGDSPTDEGALTADARKWLSQIRKLGSREFRIALEALAQKFKQDAERGKESWPPTPIEFWAMGVGRTETQAEREQRVWDEAARDHAQMRKADLSRPMLSHSKAKIQTKCGGDYIAEMRKALGMRHAKEKTNEPRAVDDCVLEAKAGDQ